MNRNLNWKIVLIIVFAFFAVWQLYPPQKTLKPGLDLAGGTSLIYEIDTQGLKETDIRGLASNMVTVLRRRIDPANIQNLIWLIHGNTRFELRMPLASVEARQKRQDFEKSLKQLLDKNINPAVILRSLKKSAEQREADFAGLTENAPEKKQILDNLVLAYDEYNSLRTESDTLAGELKTAEQTITEAALDLEQIKLKRIEWAKLNSEQLKEGLSDFPGSKDHLELLTGYVNKFARWAEVVEQLTDPDPNAGKITLYKSAKLALNDLSLTKEQMDYVLEMSPKSSKRRELTNELKTKFPDREDLIDKTVIAFDEYRPFKGRLDDPKDIQRMLKGAGILEFRILPTTDRSELSSDQIEEYVETLKQKGPKFASYGDYVWCEIENIDEWKAGSSVFAPFGNKHYVLASDKKDEVVLRSTEKEWKLKKASPGREYKTGRRAIDFVLDERAGKMFRKITSNNLERPLCILLDGLAISAPTIQSRISTEGQITGDFTATEITDMTQKLNAGSLPARLIEQPISEKNIGPSIGADNRDKGIYSAIVGFVAVAVCILSYYMLAGSLADVALILNLLFILAVMAFARATFTLPGIAGLILTIGMSVDANVLIFERIREEQDKGSSLAIAIKNGYQRAFRTILDANITTFMTAAILYWVAPEEVKGFAIVLMIGIVSSMFTSLFVTRVIFDWLVSKRIIKERLFMLRLIHKPNVNWMALRPFFLTISTLLIAGSLFVFFTRNDAENNKYDIEFTGGTSAQINLKNPSEIQIVREKFHKVAQSLGNPSLQAANIYSVGKSKMQYEITTMETNKTKTIITFTDNPLPAIPDITAAINKADTRLTNLIVTRGDAPNTFVVETSNTNSSLVKATLSSALPQVQVSQPQLEQTVEDAILKAFKDELEIRRSLNPQIVSTEKITEEVIDSYPELTEFLGGIKITCKIERPVTADEIRIRLADLRFKPDMQDLDVYNYKIVNSDLGELSAEQTIDSFVYLSVEPEAGFRQLSEDEWGRFIDNEKTRITAAAQLETSLPRVTQINPSIGEEAKNQALIAIVLSLIAIVAYIWIRFGNPRYGIAAIAALMHDVCITLGAVTACTYIASTQIGQMLLVGDFKINQVVIAAFLTLIGYSLNDTIVVFDRIRENRQKNQLNPQTITNSINQTISRTLLTSFTTFIVVLIMYIFGGQALRGFTFAIGLGIIIGTYSSIAIASPILLLGMKAKNKE